MRSLSRAAQAYVVCVCVAAVVILAISVLGIRDNTVLPIAILSVLFITFASMRSATAAPHVFVSVSSAVGLAAVFLVGPAGAAIVGACHGLVMMRTQFVKRLFNGAQFALSGFIAEFIYSHTYGHADLLFNSANYPAVLIAISVASVLYCAANGLFMACVIRLTEGTSIPAVWWSGLRALVVPYLGYGAIGLLMAALWAGGVGPLAAVLVLVPLLLARWAFQQFAEENLAYERTVASLIQAVETKDLYTRGHSERVSKASVLIGHELRMREDRVSMLRHAGMLHDVGKLGVPTAVLQKNGALDDEEFASIRLHPTLGLEMVGEISFLEEARKGIKYHHERMDGRGYPEGLTGYEIPEFARIISVADAFDSMTSTRSYRGARSIDEAVDELRRWSGTQFDPPMVAALIAAVEKEGWEVTGVAADDPVLANVPIARDHDDPSFAVRDAIPSVRQPPRDKPDVPAARAAT